jgi:predicted DNA-binding protein (UPF0278 family)
MKASRHGSVCRNAGSKCRERDVESNETDVVVVVLDFHLDAHVVAVDIGIAK